MTRLSWLLCPLFFLVSCATSESEPLDIEFSDQAEKRGINYTYVSGQSPNFYIPEIMGGGVAVFDSDSDGDLDIYFIQGGSLTESREDQPNALYINDGNGNFNLEDAGAASRPLGYGMGVAVGDVNGDTLPDIFISQYGQNKLLKNTGNNEFVDITNEAGFTRDEWSTAAAFADFDEDGDLDLWVVNYVDWRPSIEIECYQSMLGSQDYCAPIQYNRPSQDRIYFNDGRGVFEEGTVRSGLVGTKGNGLGSVVSDVNNDGKLDVFVANDLTPNRLWINQGDGRFSEEAEIWNCAVDLHGTARAGMGVTAFDLEDDGDQDLMVMNITTESDYVFRNDGDFFTDVANSIGLSISSQRYTRFGLVVADLNNDSWLDIYEANGAVARLATPHSEDVFAEPNSLYVGSESGHYELPQYSESVQTSRGLVAADLNSDGLLDLVVVNRDNQANLLMNESTGGNWLILDLRNQAGQVAIGSRVSIEIGDRRLHRTVQLSGSYLSSVDSRVHFGLGEVDEVKNIVVNWLGGAQSTLERLQANQLVRIQQP